MNLVEEFIEIVGDIDFASVTRKEIQTPQNINKRITKLSVFGNWGVRQGLLITNPFSDMKFSVTKTARKREPFKIDELREILKPE